MRKALVLMMTTCILLAGCIEGLTEDVEEVVEELAPGCNDSTAINYDENDTTATTCITEDVLFESIGEFTEKNGGNESALGVGVANGVSMTISGVDEEMGMGAYTMVSKTAANENTAYSGTDITVSGMTISQSWTIQESGDGTILQASYMGESFLMHSAMSWDDVSDDCDDSDDRDCVDAEISQEDCERRGGTWIEVTDRPIDGYCNFEDDGDRGDDDSEMTQDDCEERGGNWTEAPDREDQFYCDFGEEDRDDERDDSDRDDDSNITQEDCEERGGTWHQEDNGDYHCEFDDEDREDSDRDDERGDSDGDMDMDIPDPMEFLSMLDGFDDDCRNDDCGFPENTEFDVGVDGITTTIPTEEGIVKVNFDLVTGEMTGFTMDMYDGSRMTLELLTAEEVNTLLTIDTTLGYEALPFTLEEADAEDEDDVFICDNGEEIPAHWENDGEEDCDDGSDEEPSVHSWESYENGYCEWEGNLENHGEDRWSCEEDASLSYWNNWWYYCELHDEDWFCTDDYGQDSNHEYSADNGNYNESNASEEDPTYVDGINWELYPRGHCEWEGNPDDVDEDRWSCKGADWDYWWYYCENHDVDWHCTDDKGQSADYEHSANGTEWLEFEEPEVFVCDNGNEIPMDWVNDGMDDCGDNSDEGVEEQDETPLNRTFTITSDADFDFAGSFDDYSIVLANCVEADDMGETTLTCDEDNSTMYSLADSDSSASSGRENGSLMSAVIIDDWDSSGTLTNGDVIIVDGNTSVDWTHVRLHSTSADAYSDENPMLTPGFTTILGALSLMGAAMIGRRD